MIENWDKEIFKFIETCNKHNVKMLMVGGGAVNFHGYQRHSADVDFWLDTSTKNLENLLKAFKELNYILDTFPEEVKKQKQNISVKFSPNSLYVELITKFDVNKSFEKAYIDADEFTIKNETIFKTKVLNLEDLITSKIKSGRTIDFLDIQELKRINNC